MILSFAPLARSFDWPHRCNHYSDSTRNGSRVQTLHTTARHHSLRLIDVICVCVWTPETAALPCISSLLTFEAGGWGSCSWQLEAMAAHNVEGYGGGVLVVHDAVPNLNPRTSSLEAPGRHAGGPRRAIHEAACLDPPLGAHSRSTTRHKQCFPHSPNSLEERPRR